MTNYHFIMTKNFNTNEDLLNYIEALEKNTKSIHERLINQLEKTFDEDMYNERIEEVYDELFIKLYPINLKFKNIFKDLMKDVPITNENKKLMVKFNSYNYLKDQPTVFRLHEENDKDAVNSLVKLLDNEVRISYIYLNLYEKDLSKRGFKVDDINNEIYNLEKEFIDETIRTYQFYNHVYLEYEKKPLKSKEEKEREINRAKFNIEKENPKNKKELKNITFEDYIKNKNNKEKQDLTNIIRMYKPQKIQKKSTQEKPRNLLIQKKIDNDVQDITFNKNNIQKDFSDEYVGSIDIDTTKISASIQNKRINNTLIPKRNLEKISKLDAHEEEKYSNMLDEFSEDDSIKGELKTINHINQSDSHPTKNYFSSFKREIQLYPPKSPKLNLSEIRLHQTQDNFS